MRREAAAVAIMLLAAAFGCHRAARDAPKSVLPAAPQALRFQPPADGAVTQAQLDRYLRARRSARGRTDGEASSAVGVDPEEVAWVRARVVEAMVYLESAEVRSAAEGTYSRTIAALRRAAAGAKDKETARKLEEQIAGLERERAGLKAPTAPSPAVLANAKRIAPRRAELQAAPK